MISAVVLTVLRFYENASASYIASGRLIGLAPADYISTSDIAAQELWIVEGGERKVSWEPRSFTELIRLRGVRRDRQFCGCHGCTTAVQHMYRKQLMMAASVQESCSR